METLIRRAWKDDLAAIVAMLADDPLGATRESPDDPAAYADAFARLDADPSEVLVVAEREGEVVGTLQLSLLPGLARRGALRAQVEAVRVRADARGDGLGARLLTWAEDEARARGCVLLQLTSDRTRDDAHRFYANLGYEATHVGFKKRL